MPVGFALHLVASLEESTDPALAATLRRFANIHYINDLEFEFELPDNSQLALLEFSSLDPREAAMLVQDDPALYRPLPGSLTVSFLPDACAYSPARADPLPFTAYLYPDENTDFGESCILVSSDLAYRASVDRSNADDGVNTERRVAA